MKKMQFLFVPLLVVIWLAILHFSFQWSFTGSDSDPDAEAETGKATDGDVRKGLIFGGNGFIGASTVVRLLEKGDNITIVNRGSWYWDSATRVKPYVDHIRCNRQSKLENCPKLMKLIDESKFDYVVDFSAYDRYAVEQSTKALKGKTKIYVYVSTDSVYDACDKRSDGLLRTEEDAVRPEDHGLRANLENHFSYGHRKLEGEEVLMEQRKDDGFPYVSLRLPDVIGPRDVTHRWPTYQIWSKVSTVVTDRKLTLPHYIENYNISLVYNEDVAQLIVNVLDRSQDTKVKDEAFNVAWKETFTVDGMISSMAKAMDKRVVLHVDPADNNVVYYYPSVRCGPLNVTKAEKILGWEPTPWEKVFNDTVNFYEHVMKTTDYLTQRNEIIQVVASQLYRESSLRFYEALEELYKIDLSNFKRSQSHDEL